MSYRYQEILAWIIPGFFLISMTLIMWGIAENFAFFSIESFNKLPPEVKKMCASAQFWNAVAAVLLFLIPITSMIVGWIVNFCGGFIMKPDCIRGPIISEEYPEKLRQKNPNAVAEYTHIIKTADFQALDHLDRFYYRYVFSRNMMAAQLLLIPISGWILGLSNTTHCICAIIIIEFGIAFIFSLIMRRDLKTHASFVFSSEERQKSPKS